MKCYLGGRLPPGTLHETSVENVNINTISINVRKETNLLEFEDTTTSSQGMVIDSFTIPLRQ